MNPGTVERSVPRERLDGPCVRAPLSVTATGQDSRSEFHGLTAPVTGVHSSTRSIANTPEPPCRPLLASTAQSSVACAVGCAGGTDGVGSAASDMCRPVLCACPFSRMDGLARGDHTLCAVGVDRGC